MVKQHTFWIGEIGVTRRTKTAAREGAIEAAASALSGSYAPEIVSHRNATMVVYRTPFGWYYRRTDSAVVCGAYETHTEAKNAAQFHLAQNGWRPGDLDHFPGGADHPRAAEFSSWAQWQQRYADAKAEGKSDNEARRIADNWDPPKGPKGPEGGSQDWALSTS